MSKPAIYIPEKSLARFCRKWNVRELAVFGSVLSHEFNRASDVDVLLDFADDADWSLYDWLDMSGELEAIFRHKVDLVAKDGLRNPFRRHAVLTSREVIYEA